MTAILWCGCQHNPTDSMRDAATSSTRVVFPIEDVAVPPGLDPKAVLAHEGEGRQRANLTLEEIIASLPKPSYLSNGLGTNLGAAPFQDQTPPLAAQRSYMAGRIAWRKGKNFDAIRYFQAALRLAPNSAEILRALGHLYTRSGNRVRGGVYLEKAVQADPNDFNTLLLLGRLASEQGRWSDAIVILAHATTQAHDDTDPAIGQLTQYFLGQSLAHEHYDASAINQLIAYLQRQIPFDRTTQMARQLFLLRRQQGSTWQVIGDAYNRLNQPRKALEAYLKSIEVDPDLSNSLAYRVVYTCLRLGELELASQTVLDFMNKTDANTASIDLARYLGQQGVNQPQLADIMRQIYEVGDQPASLAMAIAPLLEPEAVYDLLSSHLETKPEDRSVFETLVNHELAVESLDVERIRRLLFITAATLNRLPTAAEEYTDIVTSTAGDLQLVLKAIDTILQDLRNDPMMHYIAGRMLASDHQYDKAIHQFEQAAAASDGIAPRVELAKLLFDRGEIDRANGLIDTLTDHPDLRVMKLKVQVLLSTGEPAKAVRFLDEMIALHPSIAIDLTVKKAKLQLAIGDATVAQKTLLDALEINPRAELVYELLLHMYRTNRVAEAQQHYNSLVKQMLSVIPHAPIARTEKARLLIANGRLVQAESLLHALLNENDSDFKPLDVMLALLIRTNRQDEAQQLLAKYLNGTPNNTQLLSVALHHYQRVNDRSNLATVAQQLLKRTIVTKPRDLESLGVLVEILVDAGKPDVPKTILDQHLQKEPSDRGLLLLVRRHAELTDDVPRLYHATEQLLLLADPSAQRSQSLAILYIKNDKPQKAIDILIQQLHDQPNQRTQTMLSLFSRALLKSDQADQYFQDITKRLPDYAEDIKFEWAMNLERRGHRQRAEALLLEVINAEPNHPFACNALGYAWADQGKNLERAQQLIRIAVDAEPDSAAFLDSLGWVLYKQGQFNDAVTWLQRAAAAPGGEYPVILEHLGDALYRVDEQDRALTIWRKADAMLKDEDPTEDPELQGIHNRLEAKISAGNTNQKAPVADAPGWQPDHTPAQEQANLDPRDDAIRNPTNLPPADTDHTGSPESEMPKTTENSEPQKPNHDDLPRHNTSELDEEVPILMPHQDP